MVSRKMRGVAAACSVAAMLLAVPAESEACGFLDCLFGWRSGPQTTYRIPNPTTAYAPVSCAPSSPCATQTCRYVPQTCYRTVCQRVPMTTCQAMTCSDPCTGCPVTTYRPVTVWTTQTRLVPYTTYRLVCSNPCLSGVSFGTVAAVGSCCPPTVSTSTPITTTPGTSPPAELPTKTFQENQSPVTNEKAEPVPDPTSDATSVIVVAP